MLRASACFVYPPWRQPRGRSMVSLVNPHTNATFRRWHMREIDLRFSPGLRPGWRVGLFPGVFRIANGSSRVGCKRFFRGAKTVVQGCKTVLEVCKTVLQECQSVSQGCQRLLQGCTRHRVLCMVGHGNNDGGALVPCVEPKLWLPVPQNPSV